MFPKLTVSKTASDLGFCLSVCREATTSDAHKTSKKQQKETYKNTQTQTCLREVVIIIYSPNIKIKSFECRH